MAYMPILNDASRQPIARPLSADARALVVAGGGAGIDGLRPLEDALTEARAVIKHFPQGTLLAEGEATTVELSAQIQRAEIFHFAGHALIHGGESVLVLNSANLDHGGALFDVKTLRSIRTPQLQMAVLSACSTENGGDGLPEDFDSLARVFLSRGVPHVIASRWNVDSNSTVLLMEKFYERLLAGSTVPQALAT